MDDQIPIDMVSDLLLPDDLRTELCISTIVVADSHRLLRFRIDPGNAFERRGYLRRAAGARFMLGIRERYLPDDPVSYVCGSDGVPAADIPDQLRAASGWAYDRDTSRDHWRDARPRLTPAWAGRRRDLAGAAQAAAARAREQRVTYFLHAQPGRFVYANNPPETAREFFSVTPRGDWSQHQGSTTYPVPAAPGHAARGRPLTPAGLARADQAPAPATIVPFRDRTRTPEPHATRPGRRL